MVKNRLYAKGRAEAVPPVNGNGTLVAATCDARLAKEVPRAWCGSVKANNLLANVALDLLENIGHRTPRDAGFILYLANGLHANRIALIEIPRLGFDIFGALHCFNSAKGLRRRS